MTRRSRGPALTAVMATALLLTSGNAEVSAQQADDDVVARIGDIEVTFAEVEDAWRANDAASRLRMLQEVYETRRRALDILLGDRLIDREAAARGMTREELLIAELPSRTLEVTEEEIQEIWDRNKDRFPNQTLEELRPEIVAAIQQQRPMQALHAFTNELREAAGDVMVMLEPPRQMVETLAEDPARGPADAPVEIVEFSDFDCPFCQRATETVDRLLEEFTGQIRFIYKDFPLPSHPNAFKAAEAGNCAHEQDRFWELHDTMFANQGALSVDELHAYAENLELDTEAFAACLDSGRHTATVERDMEIGNDYGVSSTPTLFLNGRAVLGAAPYETFEQIIREELAAAGR